jgi:hypothetical protein
VKWVVRSSDASVETITIDDCDGQPVGGDPSISATQYQVSISCKNRPVRWTMVGENKMEGRRGLEVQRKSGG